MKVKEIIKIIEIDGWFEVRQRGIHRQFNHIAKKGTVTVAGKPSDDWQKGQKKYFITGGT